MVPLVLALTLTLTFALVLVSCMCQHRVQTLWFEQRVDHFDRTDARTWYQRYYASTQYIGSSTNPIVFFELGWEAPLEPAQVELDTFLWRAAKTHKGLFVSAEHRFFGQSQPLNGTLPDSELGLVTTEQALADFAQLIVALNDRFRFGAPLRVIVSGCSYSGELAAMMRTKYSHLVAAAVAGSPNAKNMVADMNLFFPHSVRAITYVQNDNGACVKRIAEANQALFNLTSSAAGLKIVSQMFLTCTPLSNPKDVAHFFALLLNAWYWANIMFDAPATYLGRFTISEACPILTNTTLSALEQYAVIYGTTLGASPCFSTDYTAYVTFMKQSTSIDNRPLLFEVCNELGSFLTTTGSGSPWVGVSIDYYRRMCKDVFDIDVTDELVQWTFGAHYGLDRLGEDIEGPSNVLVVNGMFDGGWPYALQNSSTPGVSVINVQCGHCGFAGALSANPQIAAKQQEIAQQIDNWVKAMNVSASK